MKLGIMQPYLFPYIGYFQLIALCDKFVIHDDVQYIKGGWINRNRILVNDKPRYITLPIAKDGADLNINERYFTSDFNKQKHKLLRQIEGAYRRAPHFTKTMAVVEDALSYEDRNVSCFVIHSLIKCCKYLCISTPFAISSEISIDNNLSGETRVIEINKALSSDHYINPIGGVELYNKDTFQEFGLQLSFLQSKNISYTQFAHDHVSFMSIIDVMMFNDIKTIKTLLGEIELI